MKPRLFAAALIAVVALIIVGAASAVTYFTGYISSGVTKYSGWNYWYATADNKDVGYECIGFQNSAGNSACYLEGGTYGYATASGLGIGGYMRAFVDNQSGGTLYNQASVCVC